MTQAARVCKRIPCPHLEPCPLHSPALGADEGQRIIALLGPPASGKSTLGPLVASKLSLPLLTIDEYRSRHGQDAWAALTTDAAKQSCVTESCVIPRHYGHLLQARRRAVIITLTCDEPTRRQRIAARGTTRLDDDLGHTRPTGVRCVALDSTHTPPHELLTAALEAV